MDEVYDRVAAQAASIIEDGSCVSFSIGPLYEALSRYLVHKRDLGIHTPPIVGLTGPPEKERIIAEARYIR